jgi:hypothetical protein
LFEERHLQSAQRRIAGNPAANDAAADDGEIEPFGLNASQPRHGSSAERQLSHLN